jgi:hypothetical protein
MKSRGNSKWTEIGQRLTDRFYSQRYPLQPLVVEATKRLEIGSFGHRVRLGAFKRPHYAYCVYHSADLAKKLGYEAISVIEFGVAGGNGLALLEDYAQQVAAELGIGIEVYGFDNVSGLPTPQDYRDLPYHWKEGFFKMDEEALLNRLRHAKLVMGDVRDTLGSFLDTHRPAPLGAALYDLDFYSSTKPALELLHVSEQFRLPRIFCYFDDIIGSEIELYNDFTGVRLAIAEFNATSDMKVCPAYHLITRQHSKPWHHQIFIAHDFEHPKYNTFVSQQDQQLALRADIAHA